MKPEVKLGVHICSVLILISIPYSPHTSSRVIYPILVGNKRFSDKGNLKRKKLKLNLFFILTNFDIYCSKNQLLIALSV